MNILIVSNSFPASTQDWVPQFGWYFARCLKEKGHSVTVVAPERFIGWVDEGAVEVKRIPARGVFLKDEGLNLSPPTKIPALLRMHNQANRLLDELVTQKPFDIALALWAVPSGLWLSRLKRRQKIPFITWALGSDIWQTGRMPFIKNIVRGALNNSDYLYADGYELGREVTHLCGRPCDFLPTIRILPTPQKIDDSQITGKKFFFFVGRWERVKGVDLLIKAFAQARPEGAILLIYGIGSQRETYRRLIDDHHAQDFIFLREKADAQTVSNYLAIAHACVIPSRNESIPIVLSDALQSRCPVIVSKVGDMGELVEKYTIGMAVLAEDVPGLAAAIRTMSDKEKVSFQPGIEEALKIFDVNNAVDKFLSKAYEIYQPHLRGVV